MSHTIQNHDPKWKQEFEVLKNRLTSVLTDFQFEIEHVGSTAITNLLAKPLLDIDIIIINKNQLIGITEKLQNAGYFSKGEQGIHGRFAFPPTNTLYSYFIK